MRKNIMTRVAVCAGVALVLGACSSSDVGSTDTSGDTGNGSVVATSSVSTTRPSSVTTAGTTSSSGSSSSSSSSSGSSSNSSAGTATTTPTFEEALMDARNGDASSFVTALRASGLAGDLASKEVTVFAPGNDAFAALGADQVRSLLADPARVKQVVLDHLVDGAWPADRLATVSSVTAMSGRLLEVRHDGGTIRIDDATVTRADDSDRRVVVHVIDRVLIDR